MNPILHRVNRRRWRLALALQSRRVYLVCLVYAGEHEILPRKGLAGQPGRAEWGITTGRRLGVAVSCLIFSFFSRREWHRSRVEVRLSIPLLALRLTQPPKRRRPASAFSSGNGYVVCRRVYARTLRAPDGRLEPE